MQELPSEEALSAGHRQREVRKRRRMAFIMTGVALLCCLLLGGMTYRFFLTVHLDHERRLSEQRLEAFALSLEATLNRYEALPGLLALDPFLADVLRYPDQPEHIAQANHRLEAIQEKTAATAVFLINTEGKTLAASNWRWPHSFVGHNYIFRPYFRDALSEGFGRFYGVGVTTGEPGYFLATPLKDGEQVIGVIVLKISLEAIEQILVGAGNTLLVDPDGVVFLASRSVWRYRSLGVLRDSAVSRLHETRQYGHSPLALLADQPIAVNTDVPVRFALPDEAKQVRLVHARNVGTVGWQVVQLGELREAQAAAQGAGVAAGFAAAFVIGMVVLVIQRRRRREELRRVYAGLEALIAERTIDLTEKVTALERTESILRETRDSAVQAGKLAVLGQMSAGISHELNQPLAALHTFTDNALALLQRDRKLEAVENLQQIRGLIDRMARIVRQLKVFARKESAVPQSVLVASAIEHAQLMVEPRRKETGATIQIAPFDQTLAVSAEGSRLEQILVNLLRNGLDAMIGQPQPILEIEVKRHDGQIAIMVRDQGPGIPESVLAHLFEPFYTTKPAGQGLGLGLVISLSIAESYGGSLEAHNRAEGTGAMFVLTLPEDKIHL